MLLSLGASLDLHCLDFGAGIEVVIDMGYLGLAAGPGVRVDADSIMYRLCACCRDIFS